MAAAEIKKYSVEYYAAGKNLGNYPYRAVIDLRKSDGSVIGTAFFHRSSATLPNSDSLNADGQFILNYMAEDFPMILDILRNEKPLYVYFITGSFNMGWIETSFEPIGEAEPA